MCRVIFRQVYVLAGVRNLNCLSKPQHFGALVKVLPVEVHKVRGLMFAETAQKSALVVDLAIRKSFVRFWTWTLHIRVLGIGIGVSEWGKLDHFFTFLGTK